MSAKRVYWLLAGLLLAAPTAGCLKDRPINLRGEGFQPDPTLDQRYRAADESSDQLGFSTKAKAIESSLGVE